MTNEDKGQWEVTTLEGVSASSAQWFKDTKTGHVSNPAYICALLNSLTARETALVEALKDLANDTTSSAWAMTRKAQRALAALEERGK